MAIVRLLKAHNGQPKGTTGDLPQGRAEYLVRVKVAEYVEQDSEVVTSPKAAKTKAKKEPCKTC